MSDGGKPADGSSAARFGWSDDDVVLYGEDGQVLTPREAKEQQLVRLRSQVAEDVEADTVT